MVHASSSFNGDIIKHCLSSLAMGPVSIRCWYVSVLVSFLPCGSCSRRVYETLGSFSLSWYKVVGMKFDNLSSNHCTETNEPLMPWPNLNFLMNGLFLMSLYSKTENFKSANLENWEMRNELIKLRERGLQGYVVDIATKKNTRLLMQSYSARRRSTSQVARCSTKSNFERHLWASSELLFQTWFVNQDICIPIIASR